MERIDGPMTEACGASKEEKKTDNRKKYNYVKRREPGALRGQDR